MFLVVCAQSNSKLNYKQCQKTSRKRYKTEIKTLTNPELALNNPVLKYSVENLRIISSVVFL